MLTLAGPLSQPEEVGNYVFTVTLNNAVAGGFVVAYTTNDGTATVTDGDYVDNDGSLNFAGTAGESHSITVQVKHDAKVEADEECDGALLPGTETANGNTGIGWLFPMRWPIRSGAATRTLSWA